MKKSNRKDIVLTQTSTTIEPHFDSLAQNDKEIITDMVKHSVMNEPIINPNIMFKVGNLNINKFSLEQVKRAVIEQDYSNPIVLDFLEMFIKEAEKNQQEFKQESTVKYTPTVNPKVKQKAINYKDANGEEKFMTGDIIDFRDEISKDNHIKRVLRIALTDAANTNIDILVGAIITTPDQRFAIIKRLSQFVYEITEYIR